VPVLIAQSEHDEFRIIIQRGLRRIPEFFGIARAQKDNGIRTPQFQLILESAAILTVFLATVVMGRIEKRPFGTYGLPREGALENIFGRE
jgi:hypothetical protein